MSFLFKFRGHLTLALKLYIVVAAAERTTTDSFWENMISNPSNKSRDGTITVIKLRFLCEDMGHDSSSHQVNAFPYRVEP
jgi:hypothetical protein